MTAITVRPVRARGHYRLRDVAQMEWVKLRSVRSTWWCLGLLAAAMTGLAVLSAGNANLGVYSVWPAFMGLQAAPLTVGVLGVLALTSEYSTGMIRATFAAAPHRVVLLAAKTAVTGMVTLAAGQALAFLSFFLMEARMAAPVSYLTLGNPAVLRAVLMEGAVPCLIALFALGLGAVFRHTAAAVGVLAGVAYVVPLALTFLTGGAGNPILDRTPMIITLQSLAELTRQPGAPAPGAGFGLLCLYAAVALAAGCFCLLLRGDA